MSTHEPFEMPKQDTFSPYPPEKKGHGCWFYGCITLVVLLVLVIMAGVVIYFQVTKFFRQAVEQYTATTPDQLPPLKLSEEEQQDVQHKARDWTKAVERGEEVEPLVLDSDQLNALIASDPDVKGKISTEIVGDKIKGQVSVPFDSLNLGPLQSILAGRYLNGSAEFDASIHNGFLVVRLQALTVKGKPVSENFLGQLRGQNLAEDFNRKPETSQQLQKIESLEIKDGKIIIKARSPKKVEAKPESDAEKTKAADEDKDKASDAETKPETAPKDAPAPGDEPKKEAPPQAA